MYPNELEKEIEEIVPAVLAIAKDPQAAKRKALQAHKVVVKKQKETMAVLKKQL